MNKRIYYENQFWKATVVPYMLKKFPKCQMCKSQDNLDVHHIDYEKVNINTLKVLCRKCHKKCHILNIKWNFADGK